MLNINVYNKYIDLIEEQIGLFIDYKIDRNNKDVLRIVVTSYLLNYLIYVNHMLYI